MEIAIKDERKHSFTIVDNRIFTSDHVSKSAEIAVYAVLCRHASNDTRKSFVRVRKIAEMARCSESSVRRALSTLCEAGLIKAEKRRSDSGRQLCNTYTIIG